MHFGIIFSVDIYNFDGPFVPRLTHLAKFDPAKRLPSLKSEFDRTENSRSPYLDDGVVAHGKWCALLTKEQFKAFAEEMCLEYGSLTQTMGALGMPGGSWYGCSPAWSFEDRDAWSDYGAIVNAYVCPWPDVPQKSGKADSAKNFKRIEKAMHVLFLY